MFAVTAALIGFFAFVIMRVTTPQLTTLFTDLSTEDSSAIIKDLERQAIPFELRNDGAVIMVPKDKVTRLRMKLAEGGLPKGGGVGYEIFDKSDALGTTSFVQNINHLRALEGELARTVRAIDRIQAARVHLVLPERPLFSRETPEPSASIVVRVRGSLEPQQIRAIRHVVASAVNGLKPQRVSIVDEAGQLLADGAATDTDSAVGDERRAAFEKRMRKQVEDIVSSVVGAGRARVQLSADFDYNKITQTSDKFDPEGRVLRSTQTREESSLTADSSGQVTVNNELPGNQGNGGSAQARDQSKKSEETNNYEISRTTKTEVTEAGAAADQEADAGAPETDPDVADQFARQQELPPCQRDVARRRQHPRRHKTGHAGKLPDQDDGKRYDPRDQAVGLRQFWRTGARKTIDEAHDCEACFCGRYSLPMVSPNGPVLTRIGVTLPGCASDNSGNTSSAKR